HRVRDTLWVAIGDVAGKGLNAAVVMAMIQEELEQRIASCAATVCDPAVTMHRLHELLLSVLPSNRFATAVIAQLRDDGTLIVANAGHPPPLIARTSGTIERIGSTGPAAGILEESRWTSVVRNLAPSETLLLYTDGAIETNDFGVEGVSAALRAAAGHRSTRSVAATVEKAVRAHGPLEDDLTIVVARR
ncbi:MAG TPA: PP2C family protein-serine/threonine phosphatase, partial [Gemmatimonadaceae bacterium]|nr:PP2C family protein-serine/threonine phosphatase [Gemmatimonadaceae bacterium]